MGDAWLALARDAGAAIARSGGSIVYGGGGAGLMGAVADGTLLAGGEVHGIIPASMVERELAHTGITRLEVVDGMMARKRRMLEISDAFLILPGGIGTLDELFEALTWNQLGLHADAAPRPVVVLNAHGFYSGLLEWFATARRFGFVATPLAEPLVAAELNEALELLHPSPRREGIRA